MKSAIKKSGAAVINVAAKKKVLGSMFNNNVISISVLIFQT